MHLVFWCCQDPLSMFRNQLGKDHEVKYKKNYTCGYHHDRIESICTKPSNTYDIESSKKPDKTRNQNQLFLGKI